MNLANLLADAYIWLFIIFIAGTAIFCVASDEWVARRYRKRRP